MIETLLFQTSLVLIPLFALIIVCRAVQKGSYLAYNTLDSWCGSRIRGVHYQGRIILSAALTTETLKGIVGLTRLLVIGVTFAIYIPLLFNMFPPTKWVADLIFGVTVDQFQKTGTAFVHFLPTLIMIGVVGVVVFYLIKLTHLIFNEIEKGVIILPGFDQEFAPTTYKLARGTIIIFALAYVYTLLPNHNTPSIQVAIILTTLIGGLGAKDLITDILSGIVLTYRRTFREGDRIKVDDFEGYVVEKSLLVTNIRSDSLEIISIPNATLLRSELINYSYLSDRERFIETHFSVGYDQPWERIHQLLLAAAAATPGVLPDPQPLITQTRLDDFYSQYAFRVYIAFTDSPVAKAKLLNQLIQNIQHIFREAGVSLSSPHLMQIEAG